MAGCAHVKHDHEETFNIVGEKAKARKCLKSNTESTPGVCGNGNLSRSGLSRLLGTAAKHDAAGEHCSLATVIGSDLVLGGVNVDSSLSCPLAAGQLLLVYLGGR